MRPTEQPLLSQAELHELFERAKSGSIPYDQRLWRQAQYGDTPSRFRGSGMDYEDSRGYEPGDEPRFFNWRLMARTGEAHVKVFREERRPSVFILLDRRQTMRYGTRKRLKVTQASRIAALIAFAALHQGWSVSAVHLDEHPVWFEASQEHNHIWHLLDQGCRPAPPLRQEPDYAMAEVLLSLAEYTFPGMHIYLISDFINDDWEQYSSLLALSDKHPVFAVQVMDPSEISLPDNGQYEFVGLGRQQRDKVRFVQGADSHLREDFVQAAGNYHHDLGQQLRQYGADFFQVMTDAEKPEETVPLPQGVVT